MDLYKRMLVLIVLFAVIASSVGAVAASAQTSSPKSAQTATLTTSSEVNAASGATVPSFNPLQVPTSVSTASVVTLPSAATPNRATQSPPQKCYCNLAASSQSVKLNTWVTVKALLLTSGYKRIAGQAVQLVDYTSNTVIGTRKTDANGLVSFVIKDSGAECAWLQAWYNGNSKYNPTMSNQVAVNFENKPTKPYQTQIVAYFSSLTLKHGASADLQANLANGCTGLDGKSVTISYWGGHDWIPILTGKTYSDRLGPGWIDATLTDKAPGQFVLQVSFAGSSTYAASASTSVLVTWT